MWETCIQSLGHEDPLEKEMAPHSCILAWRIPWTGPMGYSSWICKESDTAQQVTLSLSFFHKMCILHIYIYAYTHVYSYKYMRAYMCVCIHVCVSVQSCLTLCCSTDCSPPGSTVHGTSQTRILEWVAIFYSRGSSWPRDWTPVSCVYCTSRWIIYHCPTYIHGCVCVCVCVLMGS